MNTSAVTSASCYRWIKIYDVRDEVGLNATTQLVHTPRMNDLEAVGHSISAKAIKRVDRYLRMKDAIAVINRNVRYSFQVNT